MASLQQEQQLCDQIAQTSPRKSERITACPHLALIMTSRSMSFSHVKLVFGFLCHHILWKKKHRAFPSLRTCLALLTYIIYGNWMEKITSIRRTRFSCFIQGYQFCFDRCFVLLIKMKCFSFEMFRRVISGL